MCEGLSTAWQESLAFDVDSALDFFAKGSNSTAWIAHCQVPMWVTG
jgi:hypothetical protein